MMITSGNGPRRFTWGGCVALLWLGVMLPAWAQQAPRDNPPADHKADPKEIDKARADVDKLRAELEEQVR